MSLIMRLYFSYIFCHRRTKTQVYTKFGSSSTEHFINGYDYFNSIAFEDDII